MRFKRTGKHKRMTKKTKRRTGKSKKISREEKGSEGRISLGMRGFPSKSQGFFLNRRVVLGNPKVSCKIENVSTIFKEMIAILILTIIIVIILIMVIIRHSPLLEAGRRAWAGGTARGAGLSRRRLRQLYLQWWRLRVASGKLMSWSLSATSLRSLVLVRSESMGAVKRVMASRESLGYLELLGSRRGRKRSTT